MALVRFDASGKSTEAEHGEWLYDVCERAGGGIPFACKAGACGTCATQVVAGHETLDPPSAREVRTLEARGLDPRVFRLPCLADVRGDLTFGQTAHSKEKQASLAHFIAEVETSRPLNMSVCEVRFFVPGTDFTFRPGQYVIFRIPKKGSMPISRSYSIASPPSDKRHFEVCVRAVPGGHGSNFVHRLRPGAKLRVEGPFGDFLLDEESRREIIMIANGTGISPLRSMLLHLLEQGCSRRIRLFLGVRHEADLLYTDLLRGLSGRFPQFEPTICLSRPGLCGWSGWSGRVTSAIEASVTEADAQRSDVYLCGGRGMIEDCRAVLLARGFPASSLRHESFY